MLISAQAAAQCRLRSSLETYRKQAFCPSQGVDLRVCLCGGLPGRRL